MFQNSYQGNSYFQLFDAKNIKERERPIFRVANPSNSSKQFDKQLKGYTLDLQGATNRLGFPRDEKLDLYLVQQYLNVQLFIQPGGGFALELIITDSTKTKRRVVFSHAATKPQRKPFFVKVSSEKFCRGRWLNLCIDVRSFIRGFTGQQYRSLDQIHITGAFRLKKIYTTQNPRADMEGEDESSVEKSASLQPMKQCSLPNHFHFPPGVAFSNQTFRFSDFFPDQLGETIQEEPMEFKQTDFSGNVSNVLSNQRFKETRKEFSTPKVQPLKSSSHYNNNQRKFLANTNSTEMMVRNRKEEEGQLEKKLINQSANKYGGQQPPKRPPQQHQQKLLTTTVKTNPELAKTRNNNTSIQKKTAMQQQQLKTRSPKKPQRHEITKLNPWRNDIHQRKQEQSYVKEEIEADDRDVKSANTTVFKKKNMLTEKGSRHVDPKLQTNSRLEMNAYSDSEYFELSQKFSTITDPKFFKPEIINKMSQNMQDNQPKRDQQQIEQAIEIDGTSMQDSRRQPELSDRPSSRRSVSPPLFEDKQTPQKQGFMQQHLRRMMGEIERPYTPPIHSHDVKDLQRKPTNDSKQLQLFYDQVLNCYYDFKTNTYYELKP